MAFGVRAGTAAAAAPWAIESADDAAPDGFPEIDCVRSTLSPAVARAAEQRATRLGVGADRVLIAAGTINEDDYLRALARQLGVTFEPLDGTPRSACPVGDDRLIEAAAMGLLPLTVDNEPCVVVAPRGVAARRLIAMIEGDPKLARRFRFTSAERLTRFVVRYAGNALTARACETQANLADVVRSAAALAHKPRPSCGHCSRDRSRRRHGARHDGDCV